MATPTSLHPQHVIVISTGREVAEDAGADLHDPADDEYSKAQVGPAGGLGQEGGEKEGQAAHGQLEGEEGEEDQPKRIAQKQVELQAQKTASGFT